MNARGENSLRGENTFSGRYRLIEMFFFICAIVIVGQMFRLLTDPDMQEIDATIKPLEAYKQILNPARGVIYDRYGRVLASNRKVYEATADLRYVTDKETIAQTLALLAGSDYAEVIKNLNPAPDKDGNTPIFVTVDNFLTEAEYILIEEQRAEYNQMPRKRNQATPNLDGLDFIPHLMRVYPEGELGSNILGFVNLDGLSYFGVEGNYQELLSGTPLETKIAVNPYEAADQPQNPEGASLVLTIDREVQAVMEEILDEALDDTGADAGSIVVMNPETGELLAVASTPRMDLNDYSELGDVFSGDTPFNKALSDTYEPGSVFKVLTMAAALDAGAVTPETTFLDTGVFSYLGAYIINWNGGAWGMQNMQGCMQHSLNVCLSWIATQLGPERFYAYMEDFGIGEYTGVDMAGEAPGRLRQPGNTDWQDNELVFNSFGQGVTVTPIQMATAISAVANDGKMMAPHVVKSVVQNGKQYETIPQVVGTPISAATARTLTDMLEASLVNESSDALVEGYSVAGKTGTAEIPTLGGYTSDLTNASFVGWGPTDDPKFLVYVWLEKPESSTWGSVVAAPVFREAVEQLVVLMGLPPDDVRVQHVEP